MAAGIRTTFKVRNNLDFLDEVSLWGAGLAVMHSSFGAIPHVERKTRVEAARRLLDEMRPELEKRNITVALGLFLAHAWEIRLKNCFRF